MDQDRRTFGFRGPLIQVLLIISVADPAPFFFPQIQIDDTTWCRRFSGTLRLLSALALAAVGFRSYDCGKRARFEVWGRFIDTGETDIKNENIVKTSEGLRYWYVA